MFAIAQSDTDAVDRVRTRLQNDIPPLVQTARSMGQNAPFWAVARTLFPIAESLAWLLYPDPNAKLTQETAKRLSWLIRDVLGNYSADYKGIASIICQVWRHGLTHGDEPPFLVVDCPEDGMGGRQFKDARSMSWQLALGSPDHLKVIIRTDQSADFTFCLVSFYKDIVHVTNDSQLWRALPPNQAQSRYNEWAVKFLDEATGSEPKQAIVELRAILP